MINKLKSIFDKIRTWGIIGIINYIRNFFYFAKIKYFLKNNARQFPYPQPERGITLIGRFTNSSSAGKTIRDLAFALKNAGIPFQTFNTDNANNIPLSDVDDILTPRNDFRIMRFSHIIEFIPSIIPSNINRVRSRIAFWEFTSGFEYAYPDMHLSPNVIAMSDFNSDYFRKTLPNYVNIRKIRYPFHFDNRDHSSNDEIRKKYGFNNDFVVFFNFDFASSFNRKNPDSVMKAFNKAFHNIPQTRLVFKTKSAKTNLDRLKQLKLLATELGITDKITIINDYIPQPDLYGLTNACDVYISLHRGEGFGITLAEAMFLGKPVICTNWSATTEFCNHECTLPIPYKLIPVNPNQIDHPFYAKVKEWAEPDIDAAADALLQLYQSPDLCKELGKKASLFIRDYFSIENFRKSIEDFLDNTTP
jgi:glycosyltransferase involved in cell wall biosynthesis